MPYISVFPGLELGTRLLFKTMNQQFAFPYECDFFLFISELRTDALYRRQISAWCISNDFEEASLIGIAKRSRLNQRPKV